ncbi:hypothetical protein B5C34_03875 [Pacificimonas flava]|uniref:Histidine phosphatase family protein n=2 Tax=Pacificimonas TaxID=1960290 RepID=A0A219B4C9_9SPHN|nr:MULTISPECIES: histidine phosphatase family protein [Pacificimonas]MBZ6377644.1 histidine phosphatase family protein [Pacificimonas aurantium]OWV32669.1 hypothetical protein B5C34_03875 [Pacificimonas flava]
MVESAQVTRWHLVRHAPVIGAGKGARGLLYKTHDEPADTSDADSFGFLARWLPADALLVTSGLARTNQTADAMVEAGFSPSERMEDPRFQEQFYGDWHGASRSDLAGGAPVTAHNFWFHGAEDQPPGGESFLDQCARVAAGLEELSRAHVGRNIVLVGHGGTFRAALAHALGIPPDRALTISVDNLSVSRIDHRPGEGAGGHWRTVYVNRRPG